MKKITLACLILLLNPVINYAQQEVDTALQHQSYLFVDFIDGTIILKSGEMNNAPLNYCAYDQSIVYQKDGTVMTLGGLSLIDTVYLNGRIFVPFNNSFYELIDTGKVQLYLSYTSKMRPLQVTAGHDGSSLKSSNDVSNTVSGVYLSSVYKGNFSIEIMGHYYLRSFNKLYRANSSKDFSKVFKEHVSPTIDEFIKQNNIDFKSESNLVKLVDFCNSQ